MAEARAAWTLPLDLTSLERAAADLDEFLAAAGIDGSASFVVKLVFEELGRNLVEHGGGTANDDLIVTATAAADHVTLVRSARSISVSTPTTTGRRCCCASDPTQPGRAMV